MWPEILFVLWFFLPAGVANVTPILVAKLGWFRFLDRPLDQGLVWRGKRLLGDHKTWRGLVVGVICGVVTAVIQNNFWRLESYLQIDFFGGLVDVILIGTLLSVGALMGDAMKSFIKRRVDVPSGKSLLVFDQIDYVVGAALITFPFVPLKWYQELLAVLFWGSLSLFMSYIGFLYRFKKEPI